MQVIDNMEANDYLSATMGGGERYDRVDAYLERLEDRGITDDRVKWAKRTRKRNRRVERYRYDHQQDIIQGDDVIYRINKTRSLHKANTTMRSFVRSHPKVGEAISRGEDIYSELDAEYSDTYGVENTLYRQVTNGLIINDEHNQYIEDQDKDFLDLSDKEIEAVLDTFDFIDEVEDLKGEMFKDMIYF